MKSKELRRIHREEAEARKAESDKLTPAQKLARLDKLNLTAKRERARLNEIIRQDSLAKSGEKSVSKAEDAELQKIQKDRAHQHNLEIAEKKQRISKPENIIHVPGLSLTDRKIS